jgi:hypothetical protein
MQQMPGIVNVTKYTYKWTLLNVYDYIIRFLHYAVIKDIHNEQMAPKIGKIMK